MHSSKGAVGLGVCLLLSFLLNFSFLCFSSYAGTVTVTNTLDDGSPGSLRWAINQANTNPGPDTIDFHIPSVNPNDPPQPQSIQLMQPLPNISSGPVLIDGWSQTGTQTVSIEIKGADGLHFDPFFASNSEVRGISVGKIRSNFAIVNIHHNYIGLGLDGESNIAIGDNGVSIQGVKVNGTSIISDNYIAYSGVSSGSGIVLGDSDALTIIKRNIIGLTVSGQKAGGYYGIDVAWSKAVIGGDDPQDRNVISGQKNGGIGIYLERTDGVVIKNNYIGLGVDGLASSTDAGGGIVVGYWNGFESNNLLIEDNIIAGQRYKQIYLASANKNVQIKKNIIGLNVNGDVVGGQSQASGIEIQPSANVTIGGEDPSDRNVIGGFSTPGSFGVLVFGAADITNNYIGVGLDGVSNRGNAIGILYSSGVPDLGEVTLNIRNNVIAYNLGGILDDFYSGYNLTVIDHNRIINNEGAIYFEGRNALVQDNLINSNTFGITVRESARDIAILNNSISNNEFLGISLENSNSGFITINDPGDHDEGANHLLNYPVLESAVLSPQFLAIKLKLDIDRPSALVQFFANTVPDPSGNGEGEIFLGEQQIPNSPINSYTAIIPIPAGMDPTLIQNISATATAVFSAGDPDDNLQAGADPVLSHANTSEFSNTVEVVSGVIPVDFGDAPDPAAGTGPLNYQTIFADNGAYHVFDENLFLGSCIDSDSGHAQDSHASYDDKIVGMLHYGPCKNGDDEDGVSILSIGLISGQLAKLNVAMTSQPSYWGAYVNIWIDYNKDGDFADQGEWVVINKTVHSGNNAVNFNIPLGLEGATFMRARLTRGPIDGFTISSIGAAQNGEVEDYYVRIIPPEGVREDSDKTEKWTPIERK